MKNPRRDIPLTNSQNKKEWAKRSIKKAVGAPKIRTGGWNFPVKTYTDPSIIKKP